MNLKHVDIPFIISPATINIKEPMKIKQKL